MEHNYKYMASHWDDRAEKYHAGRVWSKADDRVLKEIGNIDSGSILEIGFGSGVVGGKIVEMYPRLKYFGLDISPNFIRIASYSLRNKAVFIQANADKLPFADQTLGLILEMDAIHHFPQDTISKPAAEIARTLKKGGYAIIAEDWGKPIENAREKLAYSLQKKRELTHSGREYHPKDDEWLEMFADNGLIRTNLYHEPRPLNFNMFKEIASFEAEDELEELKSLWGDTPPVTYMSIHIFRKPL